MTLAWSPGGDAGYDTLAGRVRRVVIEAGNQGSFAVFDELLAAGYPTSGPIEHVRELVTGFRAAVPDAHWTIEEQIAQGETVMTRLCVEGWFSGPLLGLAPPGRWACVTGIVITRFADGRLVDLWLHADLLGLLCQLGVMPQLDLCQALTMARVVRAGVDWHMKRRGGAPEERPAPRWSGADEHIETSDNTPTEGA